MQPFEVERRIPGQHIERTPGRVAHSLGVPVDADMYRCDRSLREGQDPVIKHGLIGPTLPTGLQAGNGSILSTNKPDVRRSAYSPQRFRPGVHVLRVLGVGDEHDRPLLKLQVSKAEQVVVDCQDPVSADSRLSGLNRTPPPTLAADRPLTPLTTHRPDLRLSIQSPSSSSRVPQGCRLCRTGIRPPSVCKWPHR